MKKIKTKLCICIIIVIGVISAIVIGRVIAINHNNDYYEICIQAEKDRIIKNQSVDGAIYTYYDNNQETSGIYTKAVNPYFACIAARGLLTGNAKEEHISAVKKYIDWHIKHLETDGSIKDYQLYYQGKTLIGEEQEKPDSEDSYCALFLSLLEEYYEKTKDKEYMNSISGYVDIIAKKLIENQLDNGLTVNSQESGLAYIMDNVEVSESLYKYRKLYSEVYEKRVDMTISDDNIKNAYQKNKIAIEELLWNSEREEYVVGIDKKGNILGVNDYSDIYPYWSAQLYPQVFGYTSRSGNRGKEIYQRFCQEVDWTELEFRKEKSSSYWCMLPYVAALNGDRKRAEEYFEALEKSIDKKLNTGFYIGESGFLIQAYEEMKI